MSGSALLDQLTLGDHVCWTVDDDVLRMDTLAGVVRAGLRERHRVVYCGEDPDGVVAGLESRGVPTREPLAAGHLCTVPVESSPLAGGSFAAAAALRFLRREQDRARHEGFAGLRVIADMSWAGRSAPDADELNRYEAQANVIFAEGYALGVCAYDPRLFDAPSLRRFTWAHPAAASGGMAFDPSCALRIRHTRDPYGLRLDGEADLFNRQALRAVVDHLSASLPDDGSVAAIDVSGLGFADTASARILMRAVEESGGRLRLVGRSRALARLFDFHGVGDALGLPDGTETSAA